MRISSAYAFESSLSNLQKRQQVLSESQDQLTSGKRVQKASDDPVAAAHAERAIAVQSRSDAQLRALNSSRGTTELAESALGSAAELMQQARELLISAGNGSYADADRSVIGESIRGLRDDLLAVANRRDGTGRYLFGGQGSAGNPMVDGPGGVSYNATAGQLLAATGSASPLSIDGREAWLRAPDPSNPGATLSVFDVLDRMVGELMTPGRTAQQVTQTVSDGLGGIDATAGNLSAWRSRSGETLNRLDSIAARLSQNKLEAQQDQSNAEDLDMLAAISEFQNRQSGYDAALKTYSLVQQMSLFQYLR